MKLKDMDLMSYILSNKNKEGNMMEQHDILKKLINGEKITFDGHTFWISNDVLIRNSIKSNLDELFDKFKFDRISLRETNEYKDLERRLI